MRMTGIIDVCRVATSSQAYPEASISSVQAVTGVPREVAIQLLVRTAPCTLCSAKQKKLLLSTATASSSELFVSRAPSRWQSQGNAHGGVQRAIDRWFNPT